MVPLVAAPVAQFAILQFLIPWIVLFVHVVNRGLHNVVGKRRCLSRTKIDHRHFRNQKLLAKAAALPFHQMPEEFAAFVELASDTLSHGHRHSPFSGQEKGDRF